MVNLRANRDTILSAHDTGDLNDGIIMLYRSTNLDLPYWYYDMFDLDRMSDDECIAEFWFNLVNKPLNPISKRSITDFEVWVSKLAKAFSSGFLDFLSCISIVSKRSISFKNVSSCWAVQCILEIKDFLKQTGSNFKFKTLDFKKST